MNIAGILLVCSFIMGSVFLGSGTIVGTAVGLYSGIHNYRQQATCNTVEYAEIGSVDINLKDLNKFSFSKLEEGKKLNSKLRTQKRIETVKKVGRGVGNIFGFFNDKTAENIEVKSKAYSIYE